jgi:diacylglycerol kinase family enzyme
MRAALMHNPTAGNGGPEADTLIDLVRRAGYQPVYQSTDADDYAEVLTGDLDLVVVAGGDGTVDKVAPYLAGSEVPMTILPVGTANNLARALGVAGVPLDDLVATWPEAVRGRMDLCVAHGPWGRRVFVEAAGVGLFSTLMAVLSARKDRFTDRLQDASAEMAFDRRFIADALRKSPSQSWSLCLDGRDVSGDYLLVEALNIHCIGPRLCLAPEADPSDGMLDVVLVGDDDRDHLADALDAAEGDDEVHLPQLPVTRARDVHLRWTAHPLHLDSTLIPHASETDDPEAVFDVRFHVEAGALTFLQYH